MICNRVSAPPLIAWVLVKPDGAVIFGHCTCMAGRGEVCSHTAAILFYIEIGRRILENTSCTDKSNSWLPAHTRKLTPAPIAEMDFSSPHARKQRLEGSLRGSQEVPERRPAPKPTEQELSTLFDRLFCAGLRPVCAGTFPEYSELYVPVVVKSSASMLSNLQDPHAENMDWNSLIQKCNDVADTLQIEDAAITAIEKATKKQAYAAQWYEYRTGRVTASNLKSACCTDASNPSQSLIKRICYPKDHQFSTKEVRYGRKNEGNAVTAYKAAATERHINAKFRETGLVVSKSHPFFGATADLVVECDCCGLGTVEVKCPYSVKDSTLSELLSRRTACVYEQNGRLLLLRDHAYHYQVQGEIFVHGAQYGDFVLWNAEEISIERILPDTAFIHCALERAEKFFRLALMPELVGKWFTRGKENVAPSLDTPTSPLSDKPSSTEQPVCVYAKVQKRAKR